MIDFDCLGCVFEVLYFRELFTKDKSAPICKPLPRAHSNNSLNGTLSDPEDNAKNNQETKDSSTPRSISKTV